MSKIAGFWKSSKIQIPAFWKSFQISIESYSKSIVLKNPILVVNKQYIGDTIRCRQFFPKRI